MYSSIIFKPCFRRDVILKICLDITLPAGAAKATLRHLREQAQREVDAAVIVQKHWRRNQAKRRFEGMLDEVRRVTGAQAPDSAVRFRRIEFVH